MRIRRHTLAIKILETQEPLKNIKKHSVPSRIIITQAYINAQIHSEARVYNNHTDRRARRADSSHYILSGAALVQFLIPIRWSILSLSLSLLRNTHAGRGVTTGEIR